MHKLETNKMLKFNHMKFSCNASVIFSIQNPTQPSPFPLPSQFLGLITGLVLESMKKSVLCYTLQDQVIFYLHGHLHFSP